MTKHYDLIELYNKNTGEYRQIYASTITATREENNQYIYSGWSTQPLAVLQSNPTLLLFDENGEKIGDILYCDPIGWDKGPIVKIDDEIWLIVRANNHVFFTPEAREEHAGHEWLELLEG